VIARRDVVAAHQQHVANTKHGSAHQVRLEGEPVPVAGGQLHDRFHAPIDQEAGRGQR
jgi:hypothetical protein